MRTGYVTALSRFIFPGVAIAAYTTWRFQIETPTTAVVFAAVGVLFYPLYRATFFQVIRSLKAKWPGIPQYEYHKTLDPNATWREASVCAGNVLSRVPKTARERLDGWNHGVHVLYMTASLSLVAAVVELWGHETEGSLMRSGSLLLVALGALGAGVATDHFYADPHELLLLKSRPKDYANTMKLFKRAG